MFKEEKVEESETRLVFLRHSTIIEGYSRYKRYHLLL